jgi:hypothetical protein
VLDVSDHHLRILFSLLIAMLPPSLAQAEDTKNPPPNPTLCIECLKIRVGLPRIVRGPAPNTVDNTFSEIRLPNGRYRGFTAAGDSYAIDGSQPWDMGGPAVTVLKPGPPGSSSSCGQWLAHVEPAGKTLLGWVHQETACDFANGGQMQMSIATSEDNGLTWNVLGAIIAGTDQPTPGRQTGETCASAVNGGNGYYYAYCVRNRDGLNYVARAAVAEPGPGNWKKYFNGAWSQPGTGGDASGLEGVAAPVVAYWPTIGETVAVGYVPGASNLGLFFSADRLHFTPVPVPLLDKDFNNWNRPAPTELIVYPSLIDAHTGSNQLSSNQWNLFYMDVQPNEGFNKRYLVVRPIEVSGRSHQSGESQVAVVVGRWHNAALHDRWSTTGAVPGNYTTYLLEKETGYLTTAADPAKPSVELEDCVSQSSGHPDHLLEQVGVCGPARYQRLRPAGWVYSYPQEHTVPLYRCYNPQDQSHFASNEADCEKLGTMERLLGYVLRR